MPIAATLIVLRRRFAAASSALDLLGQQNAMDVRKHATRGNGDVSEQFVEFFVVLDGERD